MSVFIEIIGALGVGSYVLSYALLQTGVIKGNGYIYPTMNLAGASFVAVSLMNNWNPWQALISVFFMAFSIIGIVRHYRHNRRLVFDDTEEAFFQGRFFPLVSRLNMRRLLDRGRWEDATPGTVLTTQGERVDHLTYIAEGGAEIVVDGQTIADIGAGEFVGEMGCLSQSPASATAIIDRPSHVFRIRSDALANLLRNNPEFRGQMEFALAGNVRSKLLATNRRLRSVLANRAPTS